VQFAEASRFAEAPLEERPFEIAKLRNYNRVCTQPRYVPPKRILRDSSRLSLSLSFPCSFLYIYIRVCVCVCVGMYAFRDAAACRAAESGNCWGFGGAGYQKSTIQFVNTVPRTRKKFPPLLHFNNQPLHLFASITFILDHNRLLHGATIERDAFQIPPWFSQIASRSRLK